jgi:excisionase family DNA binding protein
MGEILTAKEVAALLKISTRQIYELVKANEIPAIKIRSSVRFRRTDLDGWMAGLVQKKTA